MSDKSEGMPFLEHLEELRWRLVRCAGAIALGVGSAFTMLYTKRFDLFAFLERPIKPYMNGQKLMVTHVGDLFDIVMNASVALGLVVASPVIVWQVWGFLSPALYRHEKRVVIPALIASALLFLAGAALSFFFVIPVTIGFYMSFQTDAFQVLQSVEAYVAMVISMSLAFGAVFELPVVIAILSALGIVQPRYLSQFRRHAVVGCLVASALITPGSDVTSLLLLAILLYLLYEASITVSKVIARRRAAWTG
jgi:sec-independent protein translocase protein TatC